MFRPSQVGTKFDARTGQRLHTVFPLSVPNIGTIEPSTSYVASRPHSPTPWSDRLSQENIPLPFRSTVGICKLLRALLSSSSPVQHILFPPHHQDPPDAVPKCKGFALVTLDEPDLVSHIISRFPYDRDSARPPTDDDDDGVSSVEESEARKAGFRTLSKERWDTLQAEYAEYRESLLCRIAAGTESATPNNISSARGPTDEPKRAPSPIPGPAPTAKPPQPQSYPCGCVLFARHVPLDTNKTALRARFSALLADADALDYVDYTKGLDSVRSPSFSSIPCQF